MIFLGSQTYKSCHQICIIKQEVNIVETIATLTRL